MILLERLQRQAREERPLLPYSPECVEEEFSEVRIASPLYGRASYVQIREFVDPAYIRS
jgi:hypothetical protein